MKKLKSPNENGQVLVLLAVGIVGLMAFVALAIDGGMIFLDRRSAQNAADAAALAGAYQLARNPYDANKVATDTAKIALISSVKTAASDRAVDNFYGTVNGKIVKVDYPWDGAVNHPVGSYKDPNYFVRVEITSKVNTSFLHLIGFNQDAVKNTVEAVAHVVPPDYGNPFPGSAMVALSPHGCAASSGNGGGIYFGGSGWTNLVGGGLFVNSDANCSVNGPGGSYFVYSPSVVDVGKVDTSVVVYPAPNANLYVNPGGLLVSQKLRALTYPPSFDLTPPTCLNQANKKGPGTYTRTAYDKTSFTYDYVLEPGADGKTGWWDTSLPNGNIWLEPGIYCFRNPNQPILNSIATIKNTDPPDSVNLGGTDVMIYVTVQNLADDPCKFTWNSTNVVKLKGIEDTSNRYFGILMFVNPRNYAPAYSPYLGEGPMKFNGSAASFINGTIYAPTCTASLEGTNGNMYQGQIVAFNIVITGTNTFNMNYNANDNFQVNGEAKIDLAR